ncbi:MAG: hypothetical protein KJ990_05130 [Proteobacteria bacterium]|nr:hypothetical protein [Pseudomonadota bacterium]
MRKFICRLANNLLRPIKLRVLEAKDLADLQNQNRNLISLYNTRSRWKNEKGDSLCCIVFSKDRAMQLHAFLTSFREMIQKPVTVHVLYYVSTPNHKRSYDDLQKLHSKHVAIFHRQKNNASFQEDLLSLIAGFDDNRIVFFVDDIVATEKINFADLLAFDPDSFVPSLRLGLNIRKNYTVGQNQPLPEFHSHMAIDEDKIVWNWHNGFLDWGYPLSIDGNIFSRLEILEMLKLISFSAPNSLEDKLQNFMPLFSERLGVAYKKSRIINIPCNKVQSENRNISGDIHQDELLRKWQDGLSIDLEKIYGYTNISPHEEIGISFVDR